MTYKLITVADDQIVQRQSDFANIPMDSTNIDYQQYLAWVAEGNEPEIIENP